MLLSEWNDYVKDVQKVGIIRVPQRAVPENSTHLYLHGFCDASERAYGACLYIQSENQEGHRTAVLLSSKSRVAPVKKITLPRLELCGAVLLTRLIQASTKALNTRFEEIRAWTDFMIVLAWITKESSRWQTFVANRVSEIQSSLPYSQWGHVSGKENPADLVSKGMNCDDLENSELWWAGLIWLQNGKIPKPSHDEARRSEETQELINAETKGCKSVLINLVNHQGIEFLNDFVERYSSISKMERLLAYCLRFIENCRKISGERIVANLTISEINRATELLIKNAQESSFGSEIRNLRQKKPIKTSSKILSLDSFFDKNGIRVGGRLQEAPVNFQRKHQIISDKHRLTKLLIKREHLRLLHIGPQALLAAIRTRYWSINGRKISLVE